MTERNRLSVVLECVCRGGVQALVRFLGNLSFRPRSGASAVVPGKIKNSDGRKERKGGREGSQEASPDVGGNS